MKDFSTPSHRRRSRLITAAYTVAAAFIFILVWKIVALVVGVELIMPSPERTIGDFFRIASSVTFGRSVGITVIRGLAGFSAAFLLALVVGIAAGISDPVRSLVRPFITVTRSVPVMSFILVAMIWFRTHGVPVFVSFLMTFPILYGNVLEGTRGVSPSLVEMATSFQVTRKSILKNIFIPSIMPHLISGISTALGVTWKAVIAAEVLSGPLYGIGAGLQEAKIQLETAEVFAWTAVAVILGEISESAILIISRRYRKRLSYAS